MTKSVKITIAVLLLLCVIIAVFPLMSIKDSEFGGADGAEGDLTFKKGRAPSPLFRLF